MGYETFYNLETNQNEIDHLNIIHQLREENEDAKDGLDHFGRGEMSLKWYECEDDLREFSKKHPHVLFTLWGSGEEDTDKWVAYFKNGKMQHAYARIEYDNFDPEKLQ